MGVAITSCESNNDPDSSDYEHNLAYILMLNNLSIFE